MTQRNGKVIVQICRAMDAKLAIISLQMQLAKNLTGRIESPLLRGGDQDPRLYYLPGISEKFHPKQNFDPLGRFCTAQPRECKL